MRFQACTIFNEILSKTCSLSWISSRCLLLNHRVRAAATEQWWTDLLTTSSWTRGCSRRTWWIPLPSWLACTRPASSLRTFTSQHTTLVQPTLTVHNVVNKFDLSCSENQYSWEMLKNKGFLFIYKVQVPRINIVHTKRGKNYVEKGYMQRENYCWCVITPCSKMRSGRRDGEVTHQSYVLTPTVPQEPYHFDSLISYLS